MVGRILLALVVVAGCDGRAALDPAAAKALADRCAIVADHMTSLDLGNYAPPAERAPLVAQHAEACVKARLTDDQVACVTRSTTRDEALACAAKPQSPSKTTADCARVADAVRRITAKQGPQVEDPQMKDWFAITIRVMRESCEQDGWTDAMKQCTVQAADAPTLEAATKLQMTCAPIPPAVTDKLQRRMAAALEAYAKQRK